MAVIFDMDGVIADTQRIHARLESEMLASYGIVISPAEISRRFSGMSLRDQFQILFSERGKLLPGNMDELSELKVTRFQACGDEIVGIEGTLERIEALYQRTPLAVASASRHSSINLVLGRLGIRDRFAAIASSHEVKRGKPEPDVFLLAAERLGVEPPACVVVEDGISGMIAARQAGMKCVALVSDDRTDYPADMIVRDLRDAPLHWFVA